MLVQLPCERSKWIYLPWKWALRFGYNGWLRIELSWLWKFRHGARDESKERMLARQRERVLARQREQKTREWIDACYKEMHASGDFPKNLPLSPAEVYEEAVGTAMKQE